MTDVLGVTLPQTWSASRLKHVTSLLNRGSAPKYVEKGAVRAISQAANQPGRLDWTRTRFHDFTGDPSKLRGYLLPGDVLINSTGTGTLGRVGYFQGAHDGIPCMADTHVTVARTLPSRVIPRFLYHWLSSQPFQDYIFAALVVGATNQIELNGDRLGDAPIPVPPLPEQRRIADFLDAEIARSTVLSALLERFSKDVNERETALLARTVNAGANTVGETLPQGWRWVPLMHLTEPLRPIMYGIVLPGPNVEHGIPIIKGGDVAANRLRADQLNRTTPEIESRYVRSRLCGGDIVIAIRGSVGEIAVVPDELTDANLTQDAARISVGPGVNRAWLQAVISSPLVTSQIEARITGATIKGINIGDLKRILIPCPPTSEQQALSTRLKRDLDLHHMLRKKVEDHTKVLTERRRALLTAAVTGQIDVTTARGVQVQ